MPVIDLLKPTIRAMRWGGVAIMGALSAYLIWMVRGQERLTAGSLGSGLRVTAVMIAAGLAFTLDDPSEDITGHAPVSLVGRRAIRILVAMPLALTFWLFLRTFAISGMTSPISIPVVDLALEFVTFAFVAYAGAAFGSRVLSDRLGGLAGAGAVLLFGIALALFPWHFAMLRRTPGSPEAGDVILWWWVLLALATFAWWWLSLPPGMPMWRRASRGNDPRSVRALSK